MALLSCKWVVGALITVGLLAALSLQTMRLDAARKAEMATARISKQWRANFEAMEATNAANVRALEHLQAESKRIEREAMIARANAQQLSAQYEKLRRSISNAERNITNERALSPVLCRTFNELRRIQQQSGAACRN